jgi:hypothetical protein
MIFFSVLQIQKIYSSNAFTSQNDLFQGVTQVDVEVTSAFKNILGEIRSQDLSLDRKMGIPIFLSDSRCSYW